MSPSLAVCLAAVRDLTVATQQWDIVFCNGWLGGTESQALTYCFKRTTTHFISLPHCYGMFSCYFHVCKWEAFYRFLAALCVVSHLLKRFKPSHCDAYGNLHCSCNTDGLKQDHQFPPVMNPFCLTKNLDFFCQTRT